jgi:hypothetical protein
LADLLPANSNIKYYYSPRQKHKISESINKQAKFINHA